MKLLYAHPSEVKYVKYPWKYCIGIGGNLINEEMKLMIKSSPEIVLFGSCGYTGLNNDFKWNSLVELKEIPVVWHSVKTMADREYYLYNGYLFVDQESFIVKEICDKYNVPFRSIRYISDRCNKRVYPWGFNHFWRKFQDRRMQLKFNEWVGMTTGYPYTPAGD